MFAPSSIDYRLNCHGVTAVVKELTQVWAIGHSLLQDRVCLYLSIYVILNLLSWRSMHQLLKTHCPADTYVTVAFRHLHYMT